MKSFKSIFSFVMAVFTMNGLMFGLKLTPEELETKINERAVKSKEVLDNLKQKQADVDAKLKHIEEKVGGFEKADITDKDGFKQLEGKLIEAEKSLEDFAKQMQGGFGGGEVKKSLGQLAAENESRMSYKGGELSLGDFNGPLFGKAAGDLNSDAASAGALVEPYIVAGIKTDPDPMLWLRDILTVMPTTSPAIEWYQEKLFTNNAQPQANEGDIKGKSQITFEKKTSAAETLAHWIPISRQILHDAKGLRAFVDRRMRQGLKEKEEEQLLMGDGTNGNLLGLMSQATAFDTALSDANDTNIDTIRRSILQVSLANYTADAIVMSPTDWCGIELQKTNDNAYLFTNPTTGTAPRLWGRRVVEGKSVADKDFLVGSFTSAATLWDLEQASLRVSDSHADNFVRNMMVLLIEERLALTVECPRALVHGTFA